MKPVTAGLYNVIKRVSKSQKFSRALPLLEASLVIVYVCEEIKEKDLINRTKNAINEFLKKEDFGSNSNLQKISEPKEGYKR